MAGLRARAGAFSRSRSGQAAMSVPMMKMTPPAQTQLMSGLRKMRKVAASAVVGSQLTRMT
jgi:hypothetical protein